MFCGYYVFDTSLSKQIPPQNFNSNELDSPNSNFWFDPSSCIKSFQLIAIQDEQKCIKIKNPVEDNFQLDFLSYDHLVTYLKSKDYYFKLSLIILDNKGEEVSLHRDLFGISPLFYVHIPGKIIAFSSNLASLLTISALENYLQPNKAKIAQYLTWLSDGRIYSSSTFFENFHNVLPGHKVILGRDKIQISQYNTITSNRWAKLTKIEEFGEEFKYLFRHSVERDLQNTILVGAQLSGGLDSSSICCMIRHLEPAIPIHTLYANTETDITDEKHYAHIVTKKIASTHHIIYPQSNNYESADLHIGLYGQPEYMHNSSSLNRSIIQSAVSQGCSTLFSGYAGDAIVGYGRDYIEHLFNEGSWKLLKTIFLNFSKQMANQNSEEENPAFKIIYSLLARKKHKLSYLKMTNLILRVSQYFDIPLSYFYRNAQRKFKDKFRIPQTILNENGIAGPRLLSTELKLYGPEESSNFKDTSNYHDVFASQSILINEQFFILDKYYGIQHKFPFYDKSLFELCMSVPSVLKYDNGRQRGHFREAMKGILPDEIRNRTSKANFGIYGRRMTIKLYYDSLHLLSNESQVWEYVNKVNFNKSVKLLLNDKEELYVYNRVMFFVSKTIYLAIWLSKVKNKSFITLN
jgi:asparagine synthase (glutamine-hydrolysing)